MHYRYKLHFEVCREANFYALIVICKSNSIERYGNNTHNHIDEDHIVGCPQHVGVLDNRQDDQQIQDESEEADDTEYDGRENVNNIQPLFPDDENIVRQFRAQIQRHIFLI